MQLFKVNLASSELMTMIGGLLGSLQFVFILTVCLLAILFKLAFENSSVQASLFEYIEFEAIFFKM